MLELNKGEYMNNLITSSEKLKSQISIIYSQQPYINLKSVMTDLIPNDSMVKCISDSIKTISELSMSTTYLTSMNKLVSEFSQSIRSQIEEINELMFSNIAEIIKSVSTWQQEPFKEFEKNRDLFDRILFLEIADEIGFPVYMEVDTELQD